MNVKVDGWHQVLRLGLILGTPTIGVVVIVGGLKDSEDDGTMLGGSGGLTAWIIEGGGTGVASREGGVTGKTTVMRACPTTIEEPMALP